MIIPTAFIASTVTMATTRKVNNQVLGNCLVNKSGYMYTVGVRFFKGMIIVFNIIESICMIGLLVCMIVSQDEELTKEPTTYIILGVSLLLVITLNLLYKFKLKCKYTLLPEGLKIEKANLNTIIPYPEVRRWFLTYHPVEYRFLFCMILENHLIKFNFSSMIGGLNFLAYLCQFSGVAIPDIPRMQQKVLKGIAFPTQEDKFAYQQLKQCIK